MIHLITRLPLPYQQTLCRTLSDSYGRAFVAWFHERGHEDFPYRSRGASGFTHYYLSEVGYRRLFQELKADPEAVVILGGWSSPMTNKTLLVTKLLGIPVFIWADHPRPRKQRWLRDHLRRMYLRMLARIVEGFLACGRPTVEHLVSLRIVREKVTNFPYWVEVPQEWSIPKRCADEKSARLPLRLLAVGRFVPFKQFEVAIQAVALANQRAGCVLAELVIAGDGPERANLEALAQGLGCETTVSFSGWLEIGEVYEALRQADALLVPSRFEAYGVVVLEAMAAGRPVMASAEVVAALDRDEGSGAVLLHKIGDVESLAEQINLLATNREKLGSASIASRQTAEKWPPERAATIVGKVLESTKRGRSLLQHRQQTLASVQTPRAARGSLNHERTETTAVATSGK